MRSFARFVVVSLMVMLTACQAATPAQPQALLTPLEEARAVLTAYLDALAAAKYPLAAQYYGGSPEILQGYNPDIAAEDLPALLEAACSRNGFMCLPIKTIVSEDALSEDSFVFEVEFLTRDGQLFEQGPCCGADPEGFVPVRQFSFQVQRNAQGYQVLDLPPYIP